MIHRFPNRAGNHPDNDEVLNAELKAAGIPTVEEKEGPLSPLMKDLFREKNGEVVAYTVGTLYGWKFTRAWLYWCAEGPGLDFDLATQLHETHGREVRVAGHCGCPSPLEWYKGMAVPNYHIDSPEGLKALADAIRGQVARSEALVEARKNG